MDKSKLQWGTKKGVRYDSHDNSQPKNKGLPNGRNVEG